MTDPTFEMVIGGALISEGGQLACVLCTPPGYHGVLIDSLRGKDDVWKQLKHKTQNTHIRHSSKSYFTFQLCPPIQVGIETLFYDLIYLRK